MSPLTRLAWWWLRWRGWAVQINDPEIDHFDKRTGWRPLFTVRHGITPVYSVGPDRWKPWTPSPRRDDASGPVASNDRAGSGA